MTQRKQSIIKAKIQSQFPKVQSKELKNAINDCINYKIMCFYRFLLTKLQLRQIKHRKIVQKIFSKCIKSQTLELECQSFGKNSQNYVYLGNSLKQLSILKHFILDLDISNNHLGQKIENMKKFGYCIKQLPKNLQHLVLNFCAFNFGVNPQYFNYIGEAFRQLYKLQHLQLNLWNKDMGKNKLNIKYLGDCLQQLWNLQILQLNLNGNQLDKNAQCLGELINQLPKSLKFLQLDLYYNNLGDNAQNIKYLGEGLRFLPSDLQVLKLNLTTNKLGQNLENMKYFRESMKFLPQNLNNLSLNLTDNKLGDNIENLKYLGDLIKQLPYNLKNLALILHNNNLGGNLEKMKCLGNALKYLPSDMQHLRLDISWNYLGENEIKKFIDDQKEILAKLDKLELLHL